MLGTVTVIKRGEKKMIYEQYFDGRKPSEKQVIEAIKRGLSRGHNQFEIAWGENMVTLEKGRAGPNTWHG